MEQLFLKLLNMSISASYLVLAVVVLRPLLKKAPKALRCVLWGLVGLRLLLPVSVESALSLIPSAETVPANIAMMPVPAITSGIAAVNSVVNPALGQSMTPAAGASVNPMQVWSFVAAWVWLGGMVLMQLYAFASALLLRRRVRTAVRWEENVWQSEQVTAPFVFGLFRPRIYLPFGLSEEEMQSVLAHERAHLARRDHLLKPLGFGLLSVYWFNPVLWLAYVLLCRDIELACDEKVIRHMDVAQRKAYSAALLKCSIHRGLAACPLAFGEVGVKQRVRSVLNYKRPAFWLILLAMVVSIVLAVCFLTDPAAPRFDPATDIIVSATTMDLRQSSGAVNIELNRSEMDELAARLRDLKKTRKGDAYKGQNVFYTLSVELDDGEWIYLRGYALDGSALDMVRDNGVYRIADEEFQRYVEQLCAGESRTEALAYVFDRSIYTNPLSSVIGPTGDRYVVGEDSFTVIDQKTGEINCHYENLSWDWEPLTQKRLEELLFDENETALKQYYNVNIRGYENPRIYVLADQLQLMDMDGELWLWDGPWRLYALAPEGVTSPSPTPTWEQGLVVPVEAEAFLWGEVVRYCTPFAGIPSGAVQSQLADVESAARRAATILNSGALQPYENVAYPRQMAALGSSRATHVHLFTESPADGPAAWFAKDAQGYYVMLFYESIQGPTYYTIEDADMMAEVELLLQEAGALEALTAPMEIAELLNLAWQEQPLSWSHLLPYLHEDIGSGRHVYVYEVGERFRLIVSSDDPDTSAGTIEGDITLVAQVDGEEIAWGDGDMADFIFRKLSRDTSPLVVSGRSYIMAKGAESSVQPSVLYIDSSHAERYDGPFTVYINGEDYDAGLYSLRDARSGEKIDVFMPSGLSQRLFVLQNTQPGLLYDVSLQYYDAQAKVGKTALFQVMTDWT